MSLELAFATKSLRQLCENEATAKRVLGITVAEKLKRRLADLRAAQFVKDLVAGRPRERGRAHDGQIEVNLCKGFRILICANHNTVVLESGRVNWSKINRVKILSIENDYA